MRHPDISKDAGPCGHFSGPWGLGFPPRLSRGYATTSRYHSRAMQAGRAGHAYVVVPEHQKIGEVGGLSNDIPARQPHGNVCGKSSGQDVDTPRMSLGA